LAPVGALADYNRGLCDFIYGHPSLMYERPNRSTEHGSQTLDLAGETAASMVLFRQAIEAGIRDYLAANAGPGAYDYFRQPPARWSLSIWAVVLPEGGYQAPHNHPSGFISGVYYARLPAQLGRDEGDTAGWIEFGPSNLKADGAREMVTRQTTLIRPEEGAMLFFPSYFWHRTLPFRGEEDRISVAFDVLPQRG
ncbi:MAG TPA: 2OG-Fe(II) oxygenase family protein, partial [Alphaproteobacteria bacterium]|nr:2OG-Fe(II) oxygenase family protein [Alphaproteobacteria bacterium]